MREGLPKLRTVLALDKALLRDLLQLMLEPIGYSVVGEAADASTALVMVQRLDPILAISSLDLPDGCGVRLAADIRRAQPKCEVLLLLDSLPYPVGLLGGVPFVSMAASLHVMQNTLLQLRAHPEFRAAVGGSRAVMTGRKPFRHLLALGLTDREIDIAVLAARGYTNKEIAETLCISPGTVKIHVSNVLAKLGVRRRHAIVTTTGLAVPSIHCLNPRAQNGEPTCQQPASPCEVMISSHAFTRRVPSRGTLFPPPPRRRAGL